MEFEKLQGIIAEVLNIEPEEVTMAATFVDDLGAPVRSDTCSASISA